MFAEVRIDGVAVALDSTEFEARIRDGRIGATAEVRVPGLGIDDWVQAASLAMFDAWSDPERTSFRAAWDAAPPPLATALLLGLMIRLTAASTFWPSAQVPIALIPGAVFEDGHVWRPFTMAFAHAGPLHVIVNGAWLAYGGATVERATGWRNLVGLFASATMGGALANLAFADGATSVGASGGVFGVMGAAIALGWRLGDRLPSRVRQSAGLALLPYALIHLASGVNATGVDNASHFGGFFVGLALGAITPVVGSKGRALPWILWLAPLGGLWAFGPHIQPMADADAHDRRIAGEPDEVGLYVPRSWRRAPASPWIGGWVAPWVGTPSGPARAIQADVKRLDRAEDAYGLLRADVPPDVPIIPSTLADVPARSATWTGGGLTHESTVALLGRTALVWRSVHDPAGAVSVTRIRDSVVWREPRSLTDARIAHEEDPGDAQAALTYAREAEARGLVVPDLDARLTDPIAALRVRLLTSPAHDVPALVDRALAEAPGPVIAVACADALDRAGLTTHAEALLENAWVALPGDPRLRSARVDRGLANDLGPDGLPVAQSVDPAGLPRALPIWGLEPDGRARRAEVVVADRALRKARVEAALASGSTDVWDDLRALRGPPATDRTLLEELNACRRGSGPPWCSGWSLAKAPEIVPSGR